jgi:hypothetical protein
LHAKGTGAVLASIAEILVCPNFNFLANPWLQNDNSAPAIVYHGDSIYHGRRSCYHKSPTSGLSFSWPKDAEWVSGRTR